MAELETISYGGHPGPGRRRATSLPTAELRLMQVRDGRWAWGIAYQSIGGFAFATAPEPAEGRVAADRAGALAGAVDDLRHRLQLAAERPPTALSAWLDSLLTRPQPAQLELFAFDSVALPNE